MKKILYGFPIICLLLVVAPRFIDWSHYKHPLVAAVKKHTGLEIDLKGPVDLQLLPTLQLSATDVAIKNTPGGKAENLVVAKGASLRVSLLPLLRGRIKIEKITLIDPTVSLEISQNGHPNWDLPKSVSTATTVETLRTDTPAVPHSIDFSVNKIEIKEGTVIFKNFQTDIHEEIQHINVEGSLDSLTGPFAVAGQLEIQGYTLQGDLQAGKIADTEKSPFQAKLSATKMKKNCGVVQIKGIAQGTNFSGDLHADAIVFPFSTSLGNQTIDLQKGVKISAHFVADPQNVQISQLNIESNAFKIKGTVTAGLDQGECELVLSDASAKVDFSAKARKRGSFEWEGKATLHSAKPEVFLSWAGVKASSPFLHGALNISTRFALGSSLYSANDLKFSIGTFQGSGAVVFKKGAPIDHIRVELVLNKLAINSLVSIEQKGDNLGNTALVSQLAPERWSKDKWNLAFLKAIDADCKLRVEEITYDHYKLQNVKGVVAVKNGDVQIHGFQAQGYEGHFSGSGALKQGKEPSITVSLSAQGVNPISIPEVAKTPLKKALLDTSMTLSAKGNAAFDVVNSLDGQVQINLKQGIIEAFDIRGFVAALKQAKTPGDMGAVMTSLDRKSATNFSHLKADFTLKDGQAKTSTLELISDDVTLTGAGTINLLQWYIDMSTQMRVTGKTRLPPIGIKVEGNLTAPSYKVDQAILGKILVEEVSSRALDAVKGTGVLGQAIAGVLGEKEDQDAAKKTSSSQEPAALKIEKVLSGLFK